MPTYRYDRQNAEVTMALDDFIDLIAMASHTKKPPDTLRDNLIADRADDKPTPPVYVHQAFCACEKCRY